MKLRTVFPARLCAFAGVTGFLFAGCANDDQRGDSGAQSVAYIASKWSKGKLIVCWMTPQGAYKDQMSATAKDIIKRAVMREYNERTTLSFIGWTSCEKTPNPDLRITDYEGDSDSGARGNAGGLGTISAENLSPNSVKSSAQRAPIRFNIVSGCMDTYKMGGNSLNSCITFTALHEFGHVAGLRHEHSHPKSTCNDYFESIDDLRGTTEKDYQISEEYDPKSIMNYCYRDEVYKRQIPSDQIKLSNKDIRGLKQLYSGY